MTRQVVHYRVVVMDAGLSSTLAVMRALRADGAGVHLAVVQGTTGAARFSHGCAGHLMHPRLGAATEFQASLRDYLRRHAIDVVLPLTDAATAALDSARAAFAGVASLAIPPAHAIATAMDKGRTLAAARCVPDSFGVPETVEPESPEDMDPAQIRSWPVLIKPRDADGARGIHLVSAPADLRRIYREVDRKFPRPIVQEQVPYEPGEKVQLYHLFDSAGAPCGRFMQRVWREARGITGPAGLRRRGGISLMWKSAFDGDLLARSERLLTALGWRGTAFVEVDRDARDGRYKLLEINPRLSGSIHLCLACGPNLAAGTCRVALGLPFDPAQDFPVGRRAKRDLFHMIAARAWLPLRDPRNRPPYRPLAEPLPFAAACIGRLRAR